MSLPVTYVLDRSNSRRKRKRTDKTENISRKVPVDLSKLKYEDMLPVYNLWKGYWSDLAKGTDNKEKLCKADLHGAVLLVTKADNPTQIGLCGIVCRETRNTFFVIKKNNCCVCIPKKGSTFSFVLEGCVYTLFGDNLLSTATGRVQKKIKNVSLPYLLPTKCT